MSLSCTSLLIGLLCAFVLAFLGFSAFEQSAEVDSDFEDDWLYVLPEPLPKERDIDAERSYLYECNGLCGQHQRCFLGKCFCLPGWAGPDCTAARRLDDYLLRSEELCPRIDSLGQLREQPAELFYPADECLYNDVTFKTDNCAVLCYWQEDAGIVAIPPSVWKSVQKYELAFWKEQRAAAPFDRDEEHLFGFDEYNYVPRRLGRLAELGAGPYTQTKSLLGAHMTFSVNDVTLIEPNIDNYLSLPNCVYRDGKLSRCPANEAQTEDCQVAVRLLASAVEDLDIEEEFDTILVVNVIEHVFDAFDYLTAVYRALKPGGVLIFGERYFDHPVLSTEVLAEPMLHPIRIQRRLFLHFFRLFQPLYVRDHNSQWASRRALDERGYYVVLKKRELPSPSNEPSSELLELWFPPQPFQPITRFPSRPPPTDSV